ncbi:Hypothetical predicted protein [Pelobates cultripes]|uniref:Uncharacterized protein n=1 Tax=Pelobates cultripes TaxID=61616 RepID=A0AAD1S0E0_PELCU|nr:Hypothetical predicted protein [Pelobates cultripes]
MALQYGAEDMETSSHMAAQDTLLPPESLTKDFFEREMEAMSTKLITSWQSIADELKTEVFSLTNRATRNKNAGN